MLSSRERYLAALRHEESDRVPLELRAGEGYRFPGERGRRTPFDKAEAARALGGDPVLDLYLPDSCFHPDVKVRKGTCGTSEDGCPLLFAEYDTPAGTLRQVVRQTDDWCNERQHLLMQNPVLGDAVREDWDVHLLDDFNGPRYIEPAIKTIEDIAKLRYLLRPPDGDALAQWRTEAKTLKRWADEHQVLLRARRTFCAEAGMWLWRFEDFLCATAEDPELVDGFCSVVGDWQIQLAELALDVGVDVLMHRAYYETSEYFSPKLFDRYTRPFIERLGKLTREAGSRFALQRSEGNTRQIAQLKKLPIDILFDVEPGLGGEDMAMLKRELGGQLTLWGGVNSTVVVNQGTTEDIDRAVREAIETCAPGGGFVIMPIVWVDNDTPWEKIQAAIAAVKRHGQYN